MRVLILTPVPSTKWTGRNVCTTEALAECFYCSCILFKSIHLSASHVIINACCTGFIISHLPISCAQSREGVLLHPWLICPCQSETGCSFFLSQLLFIFLCGCSNCLFQLQGAHSQLLLSFCLVVAIAYSHSSIFISGFSLCLPLIFDVAYTF